MKEGGGTDADFLELREDHHRGAQPGLLQLVPQPLGEIEPHLPVSCF